MHTNIYKYTSALTIAGSDSGGGAGIQADIKTFSALGCFGTSAITAITVQNTLGVIAIHSVPAAIVAAQVKAVMDDIKPSAVKIGMVCNADIAGAIANTLKSYPGIAVIIDPVMKATTNDSLMEDNLVVALQNELFPIARLVTPNMEEAAILAGMPVTNIEEMKIAAGIILKTGCFAVLVKGGHLPGPELCNFYLDRNGDSLMISSEAIDTNNTHGTGCTLSSAIAAFVALGLPLKEAIGKAGDYVHQAIEQGMDVATGDGNGPLNHFFDPQIPVKSKL